MSESSFNLTPQQVADLHQGYSTMRHNVNNNLAMMVASVELLRRKPEMAPRMIDNLMAQPDKISEELKQFTHILESVLPAPQNDPNSY